MKVEKSQNRCSTYVVKRGVNDTTTHLRIHIHGENIASGKPNVLQKIYKHFGNILAAKKEP
jgi:hypothetical protein